MLAIGSPSDAQEIPGTVGVLFKAPVERALDGGADATGQVNVGCLDDDRFVLLRDGNDAVERVLAFFGVLLMAGQANNLGPSAAVQKCHAILTTPAGRLSLMRRHAAQKRPIANLGRCLPPPAPLMIDGAALRTEGPVVQFFAPLVRIEDMIQLSASGGATSGPSTLRWQVCLKGTGIGLFEVA